MFTDDPENDEWMTSATVPTCMDSGSTFFDRLADIPVQRPEGNTSLVDKKREIVANCLGILMTGGPDEFKDHLPSICSENVMISTPSFGIRYGRPAVIEICRTWFHACPDLTIVYRNIRLLYEETIVCEFELNGTHVDVFKKIELTNRLLEIKGQVRYHFNHELKIDEIIWLHQNGTHNPSSTAST